MTSRLYFFEAAWCLIAVLSLAGVSYATMAAAIPTWHAPFSFTVVLPALLLLDIVAGQLVAIVLANLIVPTVFLLWNISLAWGQVRIPLRTSVLAVVLVALSMIFLVVSWPYGLKYQGLSHTTIMLGYNVIAWAGLGFLAWKNVRAPSFSSNLGFHWLLFAWLAWVAFPWLGELI